MATMFSALKLTTVSWIIDIFMMVATIIILVSATIVQNNINFIDSTWHVYQTDRSEKVRLETALRSDIGYAGMIHDCKNYVLSHNAIYKKT